jgi:carbon-monoxide dehydrogenase large subunit
MPGVLAVLTGEDLKADGLGPLLPAIRHKRAGGREMAETRFDLLAIGEARMAGDPVAAVIAETREQAEDAAEAVFVDYEPRDAVTDVCAAVAEGAPALWPDAPDNIAFVFEQGDKGAVDAAFANARHVATLDFRISRVTAVSMEPRGCIAIPKRIGNASR